MECVRSPQSDWVVRAAVYLCCVALCGGSSFLLYRDLTRSGGFVGERIATAAEVAGKVRRRAASGFLWEKVESGTTLHRRESVQVGENGSATLRLDNGVVLEMGENSLVVLDERGDAALQFVHGTFLRQSAGKTEKIEVTTEGAAVVTALPVELETPVNGQVFLASQRRGKSIPIEFTWGSEGSAGEASLMVQISSNKRFRSPRLIKPSAAGRASVSLEAGKYYWRVGELSPVRRFEVLLTQAPTLVSPVRSRVSRESEEPIAFAWRTGKAPVTRSVDQSQVLEISGTEKFDAIAQRWELNGAAENLSAADIAPGTWWWRVTSRYGEISEVSEAASFELAPPRVKQPGVELLAPLREVALSWSGKSSLNFRWRTIDIAAKNPPQFVLRTWRDPARSVPLHQWPATALGVSVPEAELTEDGYWDVLVKGGGLSQPVESAIVAFQRAFPDWGDSSVLGVPSTGFRFVGLAAKKCGLEWQGNEKARHFLVSVRQGEKEVFQKQTTETSVHLTGLPMGEFIWQVALVDRFGREHVWVKPQTFHVDYGPKLRAPALRRRGGAR